MDNLEKTPLMTRLVEVFLRGDAAILMVIVSLILGMAALLLTPREEEPQIIVRTKFPHCRWRRHSKQAMSNSTLAIIVSFLPWTFITGMMGPYMAPMALNVPLTVTLSTVVAFVITPWLAMVALRKRKVEPFKSRLSISSPGPSTGSAGPCWE
ncbi:MAG: efflux RND transporter permease subunit [Pirellulales bacterium]|nr:efflux RND transporter permease subunit [Pirellulales bacterium]